MQGVPCPLNIDVLFRKTYRFKNDNYNDNGDGDVIMQCPFCKEENPEDAIKCKKCQILFYNAKKASSETADITGTEETGGGDYHKKDKWLIFATVSSITIVLIIFLLKIFGMFPDGDNLSDTSVLDKSNVTMASPLPSLPAPMTAKSGIQNADKSYAIYINQKDVQDMVNKWLVSWQAGDMKAYRSCYADNFRLRGKNLNAWIAHKQRIIGKSKNIRIAIDDLHISVNGHQAKVTFLQHYRSSINKDSVRKTLHLKKMNDEWKIFREII